MEDQEILNSETGTKEAVNLSPKKVKIVKVYVASVGEKGNQKLACEVKHPDKEETIKVSSVKYEQKGGQLKVVGTWVNLDEEDKIRKGSALAVLMNFVAATKPKELEGKEVDTAEDEKGYLCFKAY